MPTLRWKKEPKETGLRSVVVDASKRSSNLWDGKTEYATVSCLSYHRSGGRSGWYWVTCSQGALPHRNTCATPVATEAEAKAQARAFVKQHLGI